MSMESVTKKPVEKKKKTAVKPAEKWGTGRSGERLLLAGMIALFVSVCGIIFLFTKAFFHSDSAFYVQLALEQMRSGKLFPPGMCYSTVLFVRSPNLLLIPILKVIKDWMMAREIMVVVMWIILILATMYCFMPKKDRNLTAAVIACMLLMNPYQTADVANETTDMLFFQGAYLTIFFDIVMTLGIMHRIILLDERDKKEYKVFLEILLAIVLFFPLLGSIRMDMILTLPLAASILIFYFLEYDQKLSRVLKSKRCMITVILIMVVVVVGFVCCRRLSVMYWELLCGADPGVCDPVSGAGALQQARKQIYEIPDHLYLGEQSAGGGGLHCLQSVGSEVPSVDLSRRYPAVRGAALGVYEEERAADGDLRRAPHRDVLCFLPCILLGTL